MGTDTEPGPIQRLRDDLNRPAGGWTTGFLTLLGAALMPVIAPMVIPLWAGVPLAILLFFLHAMWGAAGYYPRGF